MEETIYNGYKNYETWVACLWLDNDEASQNAAHELRDAAKAEAPEHENTLSGVWTVEQTARFILADLFMEQLESEIPAQLETSSVYCDLLNAAISAIDWNEVADHFLEVATATENPTIPVRIRQNHLTNSPNGAMNGDA
jgi:hypothetical protein